MIYGLYLKFWLVMIEIFLLTSIYLTWLILNAFIIIIIVIIGWREQMVKPGTYSASFFPWGFVIIFPPLLLIRTDMYYD